ncbi:hypothetical protein DFH11DRAFT_1188611 [Phellopilus nigrolimitatus]|nr:hypothetical protein DFH11DRAFT_1188611 [Phellopilus nigrolimitatus]
MRLEPPIRSLQFEECVIGILLGKVQHVDYAKGNNRSPLFFSHSKDKIGQLQVLFLYQLPPSPLTARPLACRDFPLSNTLLLNAYSSTLFSDNMPGADRRNKTNAAGASRKPYTVCFPTSTLVMSIRLRVARSNSELTIHALCLTARALRAIADRCCRTINPSSQENFAAPRHPANRDEETSY